MGQKIYTELTNLGMGVGVVEIDVDNIIDVREYANKLNYCEVVLLEDGKERIVPRNESRGDFNKHLK